MSEKTEEVPQLADTAYAYTLFIECTHEYKIVSNKTKCYWNFHPFHPDLPASLYIVS